MLGMKTQEIDITPKLIILILMFDEGIRNNIGKGKHLPSQGFGNSEEIGKHRLAIAFPVLIADGFFVPCFGGVIGVSTSRDSIPDTVRQSCWSVITSWGVIGNGDVGSSHRRGTVSDQDIFEMVFIGKEHSPSQA